LVTKFASPVTVEVINSRVMRWAWHVARMEKMRNACKILIGNTEGKTSLGRHRHRWEDDIRIELRETGWKMWSGCIWLRIGTPVAGCCEHDNEPSVSNFLNSSQGILLMTTPNLEVYKAVYYG
jgi:hypothetical protein